MTRAGAKWYTEKMSPKRERPYGKRVIPAPIKLSAEEKEAYVEIGGETDRTLSYVIRELALRGLVEYRKEGKGAKLSPSYEEIAAALASDQKTLSKKKAS